MDLLPIEILSQIFTHLSINHKSRVRRVCSRWNEAVKLSLRPVKVIYLGDGPHDLSKLAPWMDEQQLMSYAQTEFNTIYYKLKVIDSLIPFIDHMCPNLEGLMTNHAVSFELLADSLGPRLIFFTAKLIHNWKRDKRIVLLSKFTSLAQFPPGESPCSILALELKVPLKIIHLPCYRGCRRCFRLTQEQVNMFPSDLHTLDWQIYRYTAPSIKFDYSQFANSLRVLEINPYSFNLNFTFPELRSFTVGQNTVMEKVLNALCRSPKLEHLSFEAEYPEDVLLHLMNSLVQFKNLKSLEFLYYEPIDIPIEFCQTLVTSCPLIEYLEISSLQFNDTEAVILAQLKHLKKLNIQHLSQESLISYLTNLQPEGTKELIIKADSPDKMTAMDEPLHQVLKNLAETGRLINLAIAYWDSDAKCTNGECQVKKILNLAMSKYSSLLNESQFTNLYDIEHFDFSTDLLWQEN